MFFLRESMILKDSDEVFLLLFSFRFFHFLRCWAGLRVGIWMNRSFVLDYYFCWSFVTNSQLLGTFFTPIIMLYNLDILFRFQIQLFNCIIPRVICPFIPVISHFCVLV